MWNAMRYVAFIVYDYVFATPSLEFELVSATAQDGETDVTATAIAKIAEYSALEEPMVIKYKYKGTGPWACYSAAWPPVLNEPSKLKGPPETVVMSSCSHDEAPDVSEAISMFAGPTGREPMPPLKYVCKDAEWIDVTYADGNVKRIVV